MLVMPPGTGKTNVGLAIAADVTGYVPLQTLPSALSALVYQYVGRARVYIMAHTNFLLAQWHQRILDFVERVDGQPVRIGWMQRERCEYEDCDFVLISMQSLLRHEDYPLAACTGRLLIVDEAHHAPAQGYFHALGRLHYDYSLALTATPTRVDGLGEVVQWLLGPCAFLHTMPKDSQVQVNMIAFNQGRQWVAQDKTGRLMLPRIVTNLCKDAARNACLLNIVRTMHRKFPQRKGLLLSHRIEHLRLLHAALGPELSAIISGKINTQSPKTKKRKRPSGAGSAAASSSASSSSASSSSASSSVAPLRFERFITLATYQMFAEAVDFDGDFLVMAAPKNQVEQCTGRILRGRQGARPVICDLVDPFACFGAWAHRREAFYRKRGWEVVSLDASQLQHKELQNKDLPKNGEV
jgi:superfamily II DNA or RNA helicase